MGISRIMFTAGQVWLWICQFNCYRMLVPFIITVIKNRFNLALCKVGSAPVPAFAWMWHVLAGEGLKVAPSNCGLKCSPSELCTFTTGTHQISYAAVPRDTASDGRTKEENEGDWGACGGGGRNWDIKRGCDEGRGWLRSYYFSLMLFVVPCSRPLIAKRLFCYLFIIAF